MVRMDTELREMNFVQITVRRAIDADYPGCHTLQELFSGTVADYTLKSQS